MAVSGTFEFRTDRDKIIKGALRVIGAISTGETPTDSEIQEAAEALNLMVKTWVGEGIGLWLNQECILILQDDTISYDIGPTGTHCSPSSDLVKTEVATAAATAATSLVIDATTGMSDTFDIDGILASSTPSGAGTLTLDGALVSDSIVTLTSQREILIYSSGNDSGVTFTVTGKDYHGTAVTETITGPNATTVYSTKTYKTISSIAISGAGTGSISIGQVGDHIGIELDSGAMQWTYIGAALSTTTTLVDALSGTVAVDNHVYVYSNKVQRPVEVIEARRRNSDDKDIPLGILSRDQYMALSDKTSEGPPNSIYYDAQVTNGVVRVWLEPNDMKDRIYMTIKRLIADFDSSSDDADFPPEGLEALKFNLAIRLAPEYGKKVSPEVIFLANSTKAALEAVDRENVSVFFKVDLSR